jgi:hypothetical protein
MIAPGDDKVRYQTVGSYSLRQSGNNGDQGTVVGETNKKKEKFRTTKRKKADRVGIVTENRDWCTAKSHLEEGGGRKETYVDGSWEGKRRVTVTG